MQISHLFFLPRVAIHPEMYNFVSCIAVTGSVADINWFRGRVARLSSAKAPTAVRIRSEPPDRTTQIFVELSGLFLWLTLCLPDR